MTVVLAAHGSPDPRHAAAIEEIRAAAARRLGVLRSLKVLSHEAGHMFSLHHCTRFECLMNGSNSLDEMDRAIGKLGAKGIQIFTNVNGRPLDDPEFYPIFERMAKKYDLPIWVHPSRTAKWPPAAS